MPKNRPPYSVSYLKPAPPTIVTFSAKGHRHEALDPGYVSRVYQVFNSLHSVRAKAAFYEQFRQIIGHHSELEPIVGDGAPPSWNSNTMTATEIDGTVIEKWTAPIGGGDGAHE